MSKVADEQPGAIPENALGEFRGTVTWDPGLGEPQYGARPSAAIQVSVLHQTAPPAPGDLFGTWEPVAGADVTEVEAPDDSPSLTYTVEKLPLGELLLISTSVTDLWVSNRDSQFVVEGTNGQLSDAETFTLLDTTAEVNFQMVAR